MVQRRTNPALLEIDDLWVSYNRQGLSHDAVRGLSLQVHKGEVHAIIGESGSGKSTLARTLMGMAAPRQGSIRVNGERIPYELRKRPPHLRRQLAMVLQDSTAAFNPRFTVTKIIGEAISLLGKTGEKVATIVELLELVGLDSSYLDRYAHSLSGGQRQRIGIARALAYDPDILVCDEAVSALDVSVQAQILNLLDDLQRQRDLTIIFITHDIAVVSHIADQVSVMYEGKLVESGSLDQILDHPKHPYTRGLVLPLGH
jgi:ABC-type dipeptide/oligopeptide/nickel transport system ATPase subunit